MKPFRITAVRIFVPLLMAAVFLAAEPVSLESILLPVQEPVVETREPVPEEKPGPEAAHPVVEDIRLGLDDVLARLEVIVANEAEDSSELQLESSSRWNPITIGGEENWQVILKNKFTPDIRGIWFAHLDIQVEGETVASRNLRIRASLFREVWMVQKQLKRGETPVATSIQPVMKDIYLERGSLVPATESLDEYELARTVQEGHLLTWSDIKTRPSVRRGDMVDVIVEQGALTVVMRARSLEDALMGESVLVENLASNRELVGTVIGPDKIRFTP